MAYLSLHDIRKSFFGVRVLHGVSMDIERGEVVGLVGENGAGKSTLMNICSGMLTSDSGSVSIEGTECRFMHPTDSEKHGIIHIHQELNILPDLTVVENLFLGKEISRFGVLNNTQMNKKAKEIFETLGQNIDIFSKADELSIGHQQIIEIAKSLLHNEVKLIILDEPTASLTDSEIQKLFTVIHHLQRTKNVAFVYISHRMNELFEICQRLVVLRDGAYIGTKNVDDTNLDEIVNMMIGRELPERTFFKDTEDSNQKPILEVHNLSKGTRFNNISFVLHAGEILGFFGLLGSGRTDLMHAIFGTTSFDAGSIVLEDKPHKKNCPSLSISRGIGFLTEDRKAEGIFSNLNIKRNISISSLRNINVGGVVNISKENALVYKLINDLSVKVSDANLSILSLSGGNQQKSLLSRCLSYPLKILILDEPTRGIDIGAKFDVYKKIRELAQQGLGIIFVSSDLPEILNISDRIAVMHEGKLIEIVDRQQATQEDIMYLSTDTQKLRGTG